MIVDLQKFILKQQPLWSEYEALLERLEDDASMRLDLEGIQRLRFLHERVAGDLVRIQTFASEPETVDYLESLLARGFGFIHENRGLKITKASLRKIFGIFPATVRRNKRPLSIVILAFTIGMLVGGCLVAFAPNSKDVLLPFSHLHGNPSERVAAEEAALNSGLGQSHASFAATLMTHNIRVSILALVLGIFWGIFTVIVVFYNGVILGAVVVDYLLAGEGLFLGGWLLPHGSVEIPAILFAAQAGLVIAKAVMLPEGRLSFSARMRKVQGDVVVLICGVSVLLIWAGIIESFFSQYHAPVLPYSLKIAFGLIQSFALGLYILRTNRNKTGDMG